MSWPVHGDRRTFRRRLAATLVAGVAAICGLLAALGFADPSVLEPVAPLAAAAALLLLLWSHGAARAAGRRAEVLRSFAGLVVLHHGQAFEVAESPLLGEYGTRRDAARAALDRGSWAVVVHAWDRYFLLAAAPAAGTPSRAPVSFRSRAVADVVPAMRDEAAVGA